MLGAREISDFKVVEIVGISAIYQPRILSKNSQSRNVLESETS